MRNKNQDAADRIADEPITPLDSRRIVSQSFNVYDTGPAVAQVIQRGISDLPEAEKLARLAMANGRSSVSIVTIETKVGVVRTYR